MEKTLLRRFRWPIFIVMWGGGQLAGTAFYYHDSTLAGIGFMVTLFAAAVAVVLNTIDETPKEFE